MDTKDTNTDLYVRGNNSWYASYSVASRLEMGGGEELSVAQAVQEKSKKTATPFQESLRKLRRDKRAMTSLGILIFLILIPIFGPPIYTHIGSPLNSATNGTIGPAIYHNPYHIELVSEDLNPSAQYWLGTDNLGRDILARLMQGMLICLAVALSLKSSILSLGITIGVLAGYYGGWIDQLLARFTDLMFAFPGLLFVILLTGIFGTGRRHIWPIFQSSAPNGNARLLLVSLALAFTAWPLWPVMYAVRHCN